jgi:hypothetical protein
MGPSEPQKFVADQILTKNYHNHNENHIIKKTHQKHINSELTHNLHQSAVAYFAHSSSYHSVTSERFRQGTAQQSHSPAEVLFAPL